MNRDEIYQNMMGSLDHINTMIGQAIETLKMNSESMSMIAEEWVNGSVEEPAYNKLDQFAAEWAQSSLQEDLQLSEAIDPLLQPESNKSESSEELAHRIAAEIIKSEKSNMHEEGVKMVSISIDPDKHNPAEVMELVQTIMLKKNDAVYTDKPVAEERVDDAFDFE